MQGDLTYTQVAFRCVPESKQKLEKLAEYYGTKNRNLVLRTLIDEAYQAQIIKQTQTKEG